MHAVELAALVGATPNEIKEMWLFGWINAELRENTNKRYISYSEFAIKRAAFGVQMMALGVRKVEWDRMWRARIEQPGGWFITLGSVTVTGTYPPGVG